MSFAVSFDTHLQVFFFVFFYEYKSLHPARITGLSLLWGLNGWRCHHFKLSLQDLALLVGPVAKVERGLAVAAVEQVSRVRQAKMLQQISFYLHIDMNFFEFVGIQNCKSVKFKSVKFKSSHLQNRGKYQTSKQFLVPDQETWSMK